MSQNASFSSEEEPDKFFQSIRTNIFDMDHVLSKKLKEVEFFDEPYEREFKYS